MSDGGAISNVALRDLLTPGEEQVFVAVHNRFEHLAARLASKLSEGLIEQRRPPLD